MHAQVQANATQRRSHLTGVVLASTLLPTERVRVPCHALTAMSTPGLYTHAPHNARSQSLSALHE